MERNSNLPYRKRTTQVSILFIRKIRKFEKALILSIGRTPLQLTNILIANLGVVLKEKTQGILESRVVTKSNAVQRISRMTQ